jgi:cell division septation protein DedD
MKKLLLTTLLLACSIHAQDRHEFSISLGGGYSSLMYETITGSRSGGLDAQLGFGYTFFFSQRIGFATGLELGFYSAEYTLKKLDPPINYSAIDPDDGEEFMFSSRVSDYQEDQKATILQIPVMLQLQTGGHRKQYLIMGIKAAIPLSGARNSEGNIESCGYYEFEDYNYCAQKDWTKFGFGEFKGKKVESSYSFDLSLIASMEVGAKWRLQDGLAIYVGGYFDYGLGNILKDRKVSKMPQIVEYNEFDPSNYKVNGILDSRYEQPNKQEPFTASVKPMAIGVKFRLALGLGVDQFAREEEQRNMATAEIQRLEAEKLKMAKDLELAIAAERMAKEKEAERLASAEKLLQEARLVYDNAQREQHAMRLASAEVERLAAEKAQLEREVERMATAPAAEPPIPPQLPMQTTFQTSQPGEFAIQVGVMLEEERAQITVEKLKQNGFNAYYRRVSNPGKLTGIYYRVRVGYFADPAAAESFAKTRLASSYSDWWIDRVANDTRGYTY